MATAYRHMDLGTPLQVMDFLRQRMDEIRKTVELWENEHKMWAKVDQRPGDAVPAAARGLLRNRQRELSDEMFVAKNELDILQELYAAFRPCPDCNGTGENRAQYHIRSSGPYPCKTCSGSATRA